MFGNHFCSTHSSQYDIYDPPLAGRPTKYHSDALVRHVRNDVELSFSTARRKVRNNPKLWRDMRKVNMDFDIVCIAKKLQHQSTSRRIYLYSITASAVGHNTTSLTVRRCDLFFIQVGTKVDKTIHLTIRHVQPETFTRKVRKDWLLLSRPESTIYRESSITENERWTLLHTRRTH